MAKTFSVTLLLLLSLVMLRAIPVHAAKHQLVVPLPNAVSRSVAENPPEHGSPRYHKRSGRIALTRNLMSLQKELRTNDLLEITFFEGEPILIEVLSFDNNRNGTFSVSGRQVGTALATFSMTFGVKSLLMTLQDVEKQVIFRMVGDTITGEGEVVEVDQTQLPQRLAVPAPVPGMPLGGE